MFDGFSWAFAFQHRLRIKRRAGNKVLAILAAAFGFGGRGHGVELVTTMPFVI